MNIEEFRTFCLSMQGAWEDYPFDESTLVLKVMNKMFALASQEEEFRISLKANPDLNTERRASFPEVISAYHMNKKHWNTIIMNGQIEDELVRSWITESYDLVVQGLSRKEKEKLKSIE
jgi:predicted DNA-binding protein (MmcQ/YjbR family)